MTLLTWATVTNLFLNPFILIVMKIKFVWEVGKGEVTTSPVLFYKIRKGLELHLGPGLEVPDCLSADAVEREEGIEGKLGNKENEEFSSYS